MAFGNGLGAVINAQLDEESASLLSYTVNILAEVPTECIDRFGRFHVRLSVKYSAEPDIHLW